MKHIILFIKLQVMILLLLTNINAQQLVEVEATGMVFSPADVTIDVGDTVRWTNTSGFHNVNGTTATFPSNPESFGNSTGTGWVYEHIFNVPGSYNYQCDVHFSSGMVGTVTVTDVSGFSSIKQESFRVYPNPAIEYIYVEAGGMNINDYLTIELYNLLGDDVVKLTGVKGGKYRIDMTDYPSGIYFVKVVEKGHPSVSQRVIKK